MDRIIEKKKLTWWQKSLIGVLALFGVSLLYLNFKDVNIKKIKLDASKLTITEVKSASFLEYIPVDGVVMPFKSILLDALEGGMVEEIYIEDGAMVNKGDAILKLTNTNLQLEIMGREATLFELMDRLQTSKLNYEKNRTHLLMQLSDLEYNLADAERMHEVNVGLFADKVISKIEFKEAENKYQYFKNKLALTRKMLRQDSLSSQDQIRQMVSSIARMDKNMDVMKSKLENLIVKAPTNGQLSSLNAEVGELKSQGENLGQIDMLENLKIRASIDEYYINRVYREQVAKLEIESQFADLQVNKIYPNIKSGKFQVDLIFKDKKTLAELKTKIRRGQTMHLRLEMSDKKQAILVSRGGFYNQTGGSWIFVLDPSGSFATKREIKIGRQNPEDFEVLEGLKPGEKVITSSYENFGETERVIVNE